MPFLILFAVLVIGVSPAIQEVKADSQDIPQWLKNVAVWWGQGEIEDQEFIAVVQWLLDNGHLESNSGQGSTGTNTTLESNSGQGSTGIITTLESNLDDISGTVYDPNLWFGGINYLVDDAILDNIDYDVIDCNPISDERMEINFFVTNNNPNSYILSYDV